MSYEFNALYYVNLIRRHLKFIAIVVFIALVFSRHSVSRTPASYISTVTLIASSSGSTTTPLGKLLGLSGSPGSSSGAPIIPLLYSKRMARDIRKHFELNEKPKFSYSINHFEYTGVLAISVTGSDPLLTRDVANFVVENLDNLNDELDLSPNRPMVKVLDPAEKGALKPLEKKRRIIVAVLFAFFSSCAYVFFSDYIKKLHAEFLNQKKHNK